VLHWVGRNSSNTIIPIDMELVSVEMEDELGPDYFIRIVMEAEVIAVDHGIGDYEFWGSKGYHTDIRSELNGSPYVEELEIMNEDGEIVEVGPEERRMVDGWIALNASEIEDKLLEKASEDC